jgi:hypothetical protein
MKIVMVSGGRDFEDSTSLEKVLNGLLPIDEIHEGGCPTGADKFARQYAAKVGARNVTHHADWDAHGRSAGPRRNASMVAKIANYKDKGVAEVVAVFFPGGKGTANCLMNAKNKELTIIDLTEAR